jgi:hypothetical protein
VGATANSKRFGLTAISRQQLPQTVYRLGGFVGRQIEAAPSGAVCGRAFQRGFGLATDMDRHLRAMNGFRVARILDRRL